MMEGQSLLLRVADAALVAPGLRRLHLVSADGARLPPAAPGAHITLTLPAGHNSYTLVSAEPEAGYEVIVRLVPQSRGGSRHIHETLAPGDVIPATVPHNLFALHSQAKKHLFIGGGIGVTPMLAFIAHLRTSQVPFELHQLGAPHETGVFEALLDARAGERVHVHAADGVFDFAALLGPHPLGTHLYTCGPTGMMNAVEAAAAALGWPASHVHREDFGASGGEPFTLRLAKSGIGIAVGAEQTMLAAIEAAGIPAPSLCRGGACGVCMAPVLDGIPEHRDHYLSPAERASFVMPCVSRSKTATLVLDI